MLDVLEKTLNNKKEEYLGHLKKLLSIDTQTIGHGILGGKEKEGQEYIQKLLSDLGAEIKKEDLDEALLKQAYETYNEGGHLIEFWLKPAVVALGVPLYLQLEMIKKQLLPIVISQLAGCLVGLVAVVVIAKLLGATPEIICSLAPKSVTTPIAMEVSKATGGIPSLTAAVVVVVGLFGAVFGFKVLRVGHVGSPIAQGLSMGTATHAVGTSTAMEISGKYGAYASLGLTLNGIMTAIFTPTILRLLGVI